MFQIVLRVVHRFWLLLKKLLDFLYFILSFELSILLRDLFALERLIIEEVNTQFFFEIIKGLSLRE
jgi:hypothetical protein